MNTLPDAFKTVSIERGSGGAWRGEPTGQIVCPQLKGSIALMRCWERQVAQGCGFACPVAVMRAEILKLKKAMRQTTEPGQIGSEVDPDNCSKCGRAKSDPTRSLCARCAKNQVGKGARGSRKKYGRCVVCGRGKSFNPSPRCAGCAANDHRAGRS